MCGAESRRTDGRVDTSHPVKARFQSGRQLRGPAVPLHRHLCTDKLQQQLATTVQASHSLRGRSDGCKGVTPTTQVQTMHAQLDHVLPDCERTRHTCWSSPRVRCYTGSGSQGSLQPVLDLGDLPQMILVQHQPGGLFVHIVRIPNSARAQGVAGSKITARTLRWFVICNVRQFTCAGTCWVSDVPYVSAAAWRLCSPQRDKLS